MLSEVKVREDVALRLAHSAERQPGGNDIVEHHLSAEDLPIVRAYRRNSGSHTGYDAGYLKPPSIKHDVFMSLGGAEEIA
jgi:hypothetical protein